MTKAIDEETVKKSNLHKQHIERVKKFIEEHTENIAVSDEHRIEASSMAQRKQAPFVGDKSNSMADALILLSITDFLDKSKRNDHPAVKYARQESEEVESYFITSNFGDFAALPDKHTIHPDLVHILERSGTAYYPSLVPLINKLEAEFLTQDELRAIEEADESACCEVCDSEYMSIQFSMVTKVYDPFKVKGTNDVDQLSLFGDEIAPIQEPFSEVRPAYCDHCGADFITCPNCGDFVHIKENEKTQCTGCHYKFLLNVEKDRKGAIHGYEYTIVNDFTCNYCGDDFDEISEEGLCENCAEFDKIAQV